MTEPITVTDTSCKKTVEADCCFKHCANCDGCLAFTEERILNVDEEYICWECRRT